MGNLIAGIGLGSLGVLILQLSELLIKYPSSNNVPPPWHYLLAKATGFILLGLGIVFVVTSFL